MSNATPLVLLPGSLCDARLFADQASGLDGDVTVADLTGAWTVEEMARNVLANAPERFAVAGLSLGGIVAAEIAATAPERVTGVALLDTNLAMPDGQQLATRRSWERRVRAGEFARLVADHLVTPLTHQPEQNGPLVFEMARDLGAATFLQQNNALLHRRDRRDDLSSTTVPVLVACGREDVLCPPAIHDDLARRIPDSELVVVGGAGHLATIDRPDALTRALAGWLTSCRTTTTTPGGTT